MRKALAFLTVAVAMASLAGCGSKEEKPGAGITVTGPDGKKTSIELKTK